MHRCRQTKRRLLKLYNPVPPWNAHRTRIIDTKLRLISYLPIGKAKHTSIVRNCHCCPLPFFVVVGKVENRKCIHLWENIKKKVQNLKASQQNVHKKTQNGNECCILGFERLLNRKAQNSFHLYQRKNKERRNK